jgi:hypothetical protein
VTEISDLIVDGKADQLKPGSTKLTQALDAVEKIGASSKFPASWNPCAACHRAFRSFIRGS